ncbi:sigma-70 family RNA polymerase sigma factor [Candidatus Uabimicrobium sp. HlEnr_7]|uniref:sigma-70 family RNA polymerase sigma factor n=1 Tax=Candidatus Uabimicrobium helgolandensis TaxID=3095367 RepID=UPI00355647D7
MDLQRPCSTLTIELIKYIQQNPETISHMNKFLLKYQDAIFNFVLFTIGNYHDSLDLTNKVLLTLSRKVKEMKKKESFNFLVIKVIKGEVRNYWQKQHTHKMKMLKRAILHNNEKISFLETLESNEAKAGEILDFFVIRDIIENSHDSYIKDIFALKYRDGKSLLDIAQNLGISKHQVIKSLDCLYKEVTTILGNVDN